VASEKEEGDTDLTIPFVERNGRSKNRVKIEDAPKVVDRHGAVELLERGGHEI